MLIYAKLTIKNFTLFEQFEKQAVEIMCEHNGKILLAFETLKRDNNSGEEIHVLEFASETDFENYRNDARHQALQDLRLQAISQTEIISPVTRKNY